MSGREDRPVLPAGGQHRRTDDDRLGAAQEGGREDVLPGLGKSRDPLYNYLDRNLKSSFFRGLLRHADPVDKDAK